MDTKMKDKFLESARIIVGQNGFCKLNKPSCSDCILNQNRCLNPGIEREQWFKDYIKENEVKTVTPIFENEEQLKSFIQECFPYYEGIEIINIPDLATAYIKKAKEKGYIKKSIVDEAIETFFEYSKNEKQDLLHVMMYDAILELKK